MVSEVRNRVIWAGIWTCAIASVGYFLFEIGASRISAGNVTRTVMQVVRRRIILYCIHNATIPDNLEELPEIQGFETSLLDGWGHQIHFRIEERVCTLTSLGRDGMRGGTGDDSDIVGNFFVKNADGDWVDPLSRWITNP